MENEKEIMRKVFGALKPSVLCSIFDEPCHTCIDEAVKNIGESHPISEQLLAIKEGEADYPGKDLI